MKLACVIRKQHYSFGSVREVLAKASEEKSGDQMSKIAAESALERMAAKVVLSEMTLADLYENPVIPYEKDEVTRIIYDDLNLSIYEEIKNWTVGELREYILSFSAGMPELTRISRGLTSEMISATAKLMSSIDLVMASQKMRHQAYCNTLIGEPG
ncbi:MAG: ethanolamine ammonia-lyase subunit EutB, partial [Brevibacillus sp.]|nr:ethanolamine ammonia-lyase subunit EutB [Brevibacillus sp.]